MRKNMLGAKTPRRGWCAAIGAAINLNTPSGRGGIADAERVRSASSRGVTVAYFPTWKGGRRMERLRHYFHEDMACLLEMDPDVLRWSTEELANDNHEDAARAGSRSSMVAETSRGMRFIELYDDTSPGGRQVTTGRPFASKFPASVEVERLSRTELMSHPRLAASEELLFHRPRVWEPALPLRAAAMDAVQAVRDLGDLYVRLGSNSVCWEDVLSMVAQGFVSVNMDDAVGPAIRVVACNSVGHLG